MTSRDCVSKTNLLRRCESFPRPFRPAFSISSPPQIFRCTSNVFIIRNSTPVFFRAYSDHAYVISSPPRASPSRTVPHDGRGAFLESGGHLSLTPRCCLRSWNGPTIYGVSETLFSGLPYPPPRSFSWRPGNPVTSLGIRARLSAVFPRQFSTTAPPPNHPLSFLFLPGPTFFSLWLRRPWFCDFVSRKSAEASVCRASSP